MKLRLEEEMLEKINEGKVELAPIRSKPKALFNPPRLTWEGGKKK